MIRRPARAPGHFRPQREHGVGRQRALLIELLTIIATFTRLLSSLAREGEYSSQRCSRFLRTHEKLGQVLRLYVAVDRFPEWIEDTPTPEAIPRELLDQIVVLIVNVDRNQANPLHATTTKLSPSSILACYVQHEKPITQHHYEPHFLAHSSCAYTPILVP
jgi:hypothetical protein